MKNFRAPFFGLTLLLGTPALADHVATVIGAAVGGAAGTAISQNTNQSRNATILWSAVGAGAGAAVGRKLGEPHAPQVVAAPAYAQPTYSPAYHSGAQPVYAPAAQVQYVPVYTNGTQQWRPAHAQAVYYRDYDDDDRRGKHKGWKKHKKDKHKHGRDHDDD